MQSNSSSNTTEGWQARKNILVSVLVKDAHSLHPEIPPQATYLRLILAHVCKEISQKRS